MKLILNSLTSSLREEIEQELHDLDPAYRGAATALWLVLDKVSQNSFEATQALQNFITTFRLASYPHEDVRLACMQFKSILKALTKSDDIPAHSASIILKGFATSSDADFNSVCRQLDLNERMSSPKRRSSRRHHKLSSASDDLYKHLVTDIFPVLTSLHRDKVNAGTWSGQFKLDSSQHASTVGSTFLTNAVSQLALSPRSQEDSHDYSHNLCLNCGEPDHRARDCKEPFPNPNRPGWLVELCARQRASSRSRDGSRGRADSRSRDRSRGRSRDTSRDNTRRQQTPGRQRSASRSQDRKVSFDQYNRSPAANATKAALIASQLQEQLGKE
eukprot:scaffold297136_cov89-Cyclotella_meneghiniana.AAC.1